VTTQISSVRFLSSRSGRFNQGRGGNARQGRHRSRNNQGRGSIIASQPQSSHPNNPKLRTHAVNIMDGDYADFDDDDELYEDAFPSEDDDSNDNLLQLRDGSKETSSDEDEEEYMDQQELEEEEAKQALIAKWKENNKPHVRVQTLDHRGRAYGKGGRKTSTARVWIQPGEGQITINRRDFVHYLPRDSLRELVLSPFVATQTCGKFDVTVSVSGGGISGQAGAIRHGIARALQNYNPEYRYPMKRLGFLTRDSRMVERKKIGLKKARKAPQWVRR